MKLVGLSILMLVMTFAGCSAPLPSANLPPIPGIRVSGGRGNAALMITNREDVALTNCQAIIWDEGDWAWETYITRPIAPTETVTLQWSLFLSRQQQRMPAYIGQNATRYRISCRNGDAELTF